MRTQADLIDELLRPHADHSGPDSLVGEEWKQDGTCRQTDADLWFADSSRRVLARVASICGDCPVRRPCLAWALVFAEPFGVWGGISAAERRPLRQRLTSGESLVAVLDGALSSTTTSVSESVVWGEVA